MRPGLRQQGGERFGSCQSGVNVGTDVLAANQTIEAGFFEHLTHLFLHARKNDLRTVLMTHQAEVFQVVDARRVDKGHFTHTNDADGGMVLHLGRHLFKAVGHAEKEGAVDFVDLDTGGNDECFFVEMDVALGVGIGVDFLRQDGVVGGLGHATHDEQTGQE